MKINCTGFKQEPCRWPHHSRMLKGWMYTPVTPSSPTTGRLRNPKCSCVALVCSAEAELVQETSQRPLPSLKLWLNTLIVVDIPYEPEKKMCICTAVRNMTFGWMCYMPLFPALVRQKQGDLCDFEARLVYKAGPGLLGFCHAEKPYLWKTATKEEKMTLRKWQVVKLNYCSIFCNYCPIAYILTDVPIWMSTTTGGRVKSGQTAIYPCDNILYSKERKLLQYTIQMNFTQVYQANM